MKTNSSATRMETTMDHGQTNTSKIVTVTRMTRMSKSLLATVLIVVGIASASDPIPAPKQKKPIALVGGMIHTVSGAVIQNGTVMFDKGKITAVGTNVAIPADAERINVTG